MLRKASLLAAGVVASNPAAQGAPKPQLQSQDHDALVCRPSELPIYGSIRPPK